MPSPTSSDHPAAPKATPSAPAHNVNRRRFLLTMGAGGAAAAATAAAAPAAAALPDEMLQPAEATTGYRVTDHIRDYYRSTKL